MSSDSGESHDENVEEMETNEDNDETSSKNEDTHDENEEETESTKKKYKKTVKNGDIHDENDKKIKTPKKKAKTTKTKVTTTKKKGRKSLKNGDAHDENGETKETTEDEKEEKKIKKVKKIRPAGELVEEITERDDLTAYFEQRDHSVNQLHQSKVPQICKDEPCQLGVDEAGRGPVLGPMVYGIAYAPLSNKKLLVDMGCADSKTLSEEKRDAIFDKVVDNSDKMGWAVDAISPNYIANCMYKRCKTSLNEVSMNSAINLIKKTIEAGAFVTEIYVDTVGKPEKYQTKLELIFPGIKITVAKKADSTYPIVSAASICAKVSRDHALRAWQFREAENETEYGSGYPNDPATKTWLTNNVDPVFGFPQLVRFSWSTAEKILEANAAEVEWEEIEEEPPAFGVKISKFFAPSPAKTKENARNRHSFFKNRCLTSATTL